jgi:hypothetical protein
MSSSDSKSSSGAIDTERPAICRDLQYWKQREERRGNGIEERELEKRGGRERGKSREEGRRREGK